jgi:uncharacterized protein YfaS (alpha-2-macroglobulin family)
MLENTKNSWLKFTDKGIGKALFSPLNPVLRSIYHPIKNFTRKHPQRTRVLLGLVGGIIIITPVIALAGVLLLTPESEPQLSEEEQEAKEIIEGFFLQEQLEIELRSEELEELPVLDGLTFETNVETIDTELIATGVETMPNTEIRVQFDEDSNTLAITPARRWEFGETYEVTINQGSYGNIVLDEDVTVEFSTSEKLFSKGNSLIWVDSFYNSAHEFSYNLPDNYQSSQINLELFESDIDTVKAQIAELSEYIEDRELATFAQSKKISEWTQPVEDEKGVIVKVPVEAAGIYGLNIKDGQGEMTSQHFVVINTYALAAQTTDDRVELFVSDLEATNPIDNVEIEFYNYDEVDGLEEIDSQSVSGLSQLSSDAADNAEFIFAQKDGEYAFLNLINSIYTERQSGDNMISYFSSQSRSNFTYFDKPIYKPDDVARFKSVIRDRTNGRYELPEAGKQYKYEVKASIGGVDKVTIWEKNFQTDVFGTINGEIDIAELQNPSTSNDLYLYIDGQQSETINISNYQKPQYEAEINFDKDQYSNNDQIVVSVNTKTYAGNPATAGEVKLDLSHGYLGAECEGFINRGSYSEILDNSIPLNDNGIVVQEDTLTGHIYPSRIRASVRVSAGLGSSDFYHSSVPYYPAEYSLFVKQAQRAFLPGESVDIELAKYDENCALSSNSNSITLSGKRTEYIKIPVNDSRGYTYERVEENIEGLTVEIDEDGKYLLNRAFDETGYYNLTAISTDEQGNETATQVGFSISSENVSLQEEPEDPDFVFSVDKEIYEVGDNVTATVNTNGIRGTGWLVVTGENIITSRLIDFTADEFQIEIPYRQQLLPNASVSLSVFAKDDYLKESEPLDFNLDSKQIDVNLTTNKGDYNPGETVEVQVQTNLLQSQQAIKSDVSLAVIDTALLDLSDRNVGKEIFSNFWRTRYIDDRVFNSLDFSVFSLGGLGDGGGGQATPRKDFKDSALWLANVETNDEGVASVEFELPDNLTRWTVIAVANSQNNDFGSGEIDITSNLPLAIETNFPQVLTEADQPDLLAFVSNTTDEELSVTVDAEVSAGDASIDDAGEQEIEVAANSTKLVRWQVTLGENADELELLVNAKSERYRDAVQIKSTVEKLAYREISYQNRNGSFSEEVQLEEPAASEIEIRVNSDLRQKLEPALQSYTRPNNSVNNNEQLASRLIIASEVLNNYELYGDVVDASERQLKINIQRDQLALYYHQNRDGGWSWWQDNDISESQNFVTAHVVRALEASSTHSTVPTDIITPAKEYVRKVEDSYQSNQDDNQLLREYAYSLFVLSQFETVSQPELESLLDRDIDSASLSYIIIAANNSGYESTSRDGEQLLLDKAETGEGSTSWSVSEHVFYPYSTDLSFNNYATTTALLALAESESEQDVVDTTTNYLMRVNSNNFSADSLAIVNLTTALPSTSIGRTSQEPSYTISNNDELILDSNDLDDPSNISLLVTNISEQNNIELNLEEGSPVSTDLIITNAVEDKPDSGVIEVDKELFGAEGRFGENLKLGQYGLIRIDLEKSGQLQAMEIEDGIAAGMDIISTYSGRRYFDYEVYRNIIILDRRQSSTTAFARFLPESYPYHDQNTSSQSVYYIVAANNSGTYYMQPTTVKGLYLPGEIGYGDIQQVELEY